MIFLQKIKNDAYSILDKQENFMDQAIDKQDIELKKVELDQIIGEKIKEAKQKN